MEAPWSRFYTWLYNRGLDEQFPEETRFLGLEYIPRYWSKWGGYGWTYRWYSSLVNHTDVPTGKELLQVTTAKQLPASYLYIDTTGVESVRRIHSGLTALKENVPRSRSYQELIISEDKCFETCLSVNRHEGKTTATPVCVEACHGGRRQAAADLKAQLQKWKDTAVSCLRSHSVSGGDGNQAEFEKCLATYAEEVVHHGTDEEHLNTWLGEYKKVTVDTALTSDINLTMNKPQH